jgi:8-oxo-dGTP diphosphatase
MARRVAFCLVENDKTQVLLIQRGYGKEKGKWSLPGGFVDKGESSRHAAYRETKEETGLIVEIVSTV